MCCLTGNSATCRLKDIIKSCNLAYCRLIQNICLVVSYLFMKLKSELKYNRDFQIIFVAVSFYASACLGHFLTFDSTTALPTWPPSGIAFALIILLGRSAWPGITIGSLVANIMAHWNDPALPVQSVIAISSFTAIANTFEALIGNWLIKNWVGDDYPFKSSRGSFQFLFVAVLMCLAGALLGTFVLFICQVIPAGDILKTCISWWVGNVVGVLLFTPFILCIARHHQLKFTPEKVLEVCLFIIGTVGIGLLLQVEYFSATIQRALPFLILPFFMWLAFRFELIVAMGAVLIVSILSIYFTVENQGPFVLAEPYYSMLLLQIFIGVMSISTLVLSATVKERTIAQRTLLEFNENLEAKVLERTKALHDEILIRKEAESKLQRSNQELSKRNTELDNFVYSVSHDLRAPIASVLGLINLAKKDKDRAMKDTYLDMINNSALQQDHFIKEILDQSRNSRLDVKREEILFQPIIDETFNQLSFATPTGKGVEKIVSVQQVKPFYCDRWRLKVILNNIISNAIRYRNGRDPVIKVNVEVTEKGAQVSIEDNGKGIAKEHLNHVFRMFYRATDDGAGSGLGLYIVKETIDKLNGSIKIDSIEGKGTTVQLMIPEVAVN
jgi:signal transduction histidine kinase